MSIYISYSMLKQAYCVEMGTWSVNLVDNGIQQIQICYGIARDQSS